MVRQGWRSGVEVRSPEQHARLDSTVHATSAYSLVGVISKCPHKV